LHSQPGAGGRTDEKGDVVLQLAKRDLPVSVTISASGHHQLQIPLLVKDLIVSQEMLSFDDLYPHHTLNVRVHASMRPSDSAGE